MHLQSALGLCGIAVMRSVLEAQFGIKTEENELIEIKIFDPRVGLREYSTDEFDLVWKSNDEKWFLVAVPKEIKLNLKGKYL
ncbi:hypothetical protein HZC30_02970 [Candidatus Woesearchaeota archaeon]|nr:hypothetical protein [Candidatus Woesearchaeota archaeon]